MSVFFSYCGDATRQSLQLGFGFHSKKAVYWCHERGELPSLLYAGVKILVFLFLVQCRKTLLWQPQLVGRGVRIRVDKLHIDHVVCPLLPQVPDDKVPPLLGVHHWPWLFVGFYRLGMCCTPAPSGANWCD